jgi:hypothetical protein
MRNAREVFSMKDRTHCPSGDCYKAAYDFAEHWSDMTRSGNVENAPLSLVHGDVIPISGPDKDRRINHAWVEVGEAVWEVSNGQSLRYTKRDYYRTFQVRDRIRYAFQDARLEYAKSMHYGPWDTDSADPAVNL